MCSGPELFAGMTRDEWIAALANFWRCSIAVAECRVRSLAEAQGE